MAMKIWFMVIGLLIVSAPQEGISQTAPAAPPAQASTATDPAGKDSAPEEPPIVVSHSIQVHGKPLAYTTTTGMMRLKDEAGKFKAGLFFMAYTATTPDPSSQRPVTFVFNGGPGASSMWLHLGALGPKRVITEAGEPLVLPPYALTVNESTWLSFTDLVFIDPVGTGFSRPAPGENAKQFYGIDEDVQAVGELIRLYTARYERWLSPKFLAGESYGTLRAVELADYLYDRFGMLVNGLVIISPAIQFQTFSFHIGNDLPYVVFLPSYAATAWYHNKLPSELQEDLPKTLREVEAWSLGEYTAALAQGDALPEPDRSRILDRLVRYTGLSRESIERSNLRVHRSVFMNELLRPEDRSVGLMDGRWTRPGRSADAASDVGMVMTVGPYAAALNDYLKRELHYESDLPYIYLSPEASRQWNWGSGMPRYVNVLDTLAEVIKRSPGMKVFAASGYFDLNTPYTGARYSLTHLGLDANLQRNLTIRDYEGGHMFYTHEPSLQRFTNDVAAFMHETLAGGMGDEKKGAPELGDQALGAAFPGAVRGF